MLDGKLRISPNLPAAWKKLNYTRLWKGQKLSVTISEAVTFRFRKTQTATQRSGCGLERSRDKMSER